MEPQFKAYYSKGWSCIFIIAAVIFLLGAVLAFSFRTPALIVVSVLFIASAIVLIYKFISEIRKDGVAVEISEDKLILYKRNVVSIDLSEIDQILINDADGSFDLIIKGRFGKASMHCFIKNQRAKKREFIDALERRHVHIFRMNLD